MTPLLRSLGFTLLLLLPAQAAEFVLPPETPFAVVSMPDSWRPGEFTNGVEATSPDRTTYIAFEVIAPGEIARSTRANLRFLRQQGVDLDQATQAEKDYALNGFGSYELTWSGRDKSGPAQVTMTLLFISRDRYVMMTNWTTPDGARLNREPIREIIQSLKVAPPGTPARPQGEALVVAPPVADNRVLSAPVVAPGTPAATPPIRPTLPATGPLAR